MSDCACWCGNSRLVAFNDDYALCEVCQTLVLRHAPAQVDPHVRDDQADFYGRSYWFEHMEQKQGYANIVERSRLDLSGRCVHWLRSVLRYKKPPGKSLELGCGNGSFVAMMQWSGFEAAGSELSPWVVDYARSTFAIPMLLGPLEDQHIEAASLDIVVLMDVLEHLPDPLATVRQAATLLKSDGLFVAQTPEFREGMTFADLTARNDPFLIQLKPNEHIHLFSRKSAAMLFERAGLGHVVFEPAIFSDYDMFPLASRVALTPLEAAPATHIRSHATSPLGRTIEALLDLYGQFSELKTLAESRQKTIERQSRHINELSADYDRRLVVITQEQAKVAELSLMVEQLNGTLAALHSALAERTRQVDEKAATIDAMTRHVDQLSADYHLRGQAIAELRTSIDASLEREKQHADDAAARMQQLAERDEQIRQLAAVAEHHRSRLAEQQSALDEQIRQIAALDEQVRGLGAEGEKRLAQIRILESQLSAQGDELCRLSVDYDRRLEAITLRDGQITEQAKTVAEQHEHIVRLSADYERRLQVIHNHEAKIAELTQYIGRQQEAMERAAAKSRSLEGKIESLRVQLVASAEELKALQSRLGVRMLSRLGLA